MNIVQRHQWGGPSSAFGTVMQSRPVSLVVIHHTVGTVAANRGDAAERRQTFDWHEQHARKWAGIGYNFIIYQSGSVHEGRGFGRGGAHAGVRAINDSSIGIAFAIDARTTTPSDAAVASFIRLCEHAQREGYLAKVFAIEPHNKYNTTTECPGPRLIALLPALRTAALSVEPTPSRVGTRVFSPLIGEHLIVSRYGSDTDWDYITETQLRSMPATKAGTPLSQMPAARQ